MQRIFRAVKKKRNLRRLGAMWLFLIVLELFCPVFCEMQTFAAEPKFPSPEKTFSVDRENDSTENFVSACNHQNSHHEQITCNDECLCHATAIPNLGIIAHKESVVRSEPIAFNFGEPIFNSLPPPYHPPKLS